MNFRKPAAAALLAIAFASCKRDTSAQCGPVNTQAPASEVATLQQYITNSNIAATADSRGFYYSITSTGSGTKPTVCSTVKVNYVGKLTNGNQFDAGNGVSFSLSDLIVGWQEGIPLIAAGGSIMLYLPPSLAYGSKGSNGIPANSILIFKIDLITVDN